MHLVFEQIRVGGDRNFAYLLGDRAAGVAALIDPSYSPEAVVQRARDQHLRVTHVLNTHSHPDHVNGNEVAAALTGVAVSRLAEGAVVPIGSLALRVLHVPGHCDDHVALYEPTHALLVTGDLLFVGKVGGTARDEDARVEWDSLQRLLREIPPQATVWPGHDYGARPSSTLALERASNPFLQCRDVDAFLALKRDWPEVKKRYGLR
jgi:glyoxylase-like metal-dependent hydrolase (beta-lactamase superfamily II)